jgi:hypothetical protein
MVVDMAKSAPPAAAKNGSKQANKRGARHMRRPAGRGLPQKNRTPISISRRSHRETGIVRGAQLSLGAANLTAGQSFDILAKFVYYTPFTP